MIIKGLYPICETIANNTIRTIAAIKSNSPWAAHACLDRIIEAATELQKLLKKNERS